MIQNVVQASINRVNFGNTAGNVSKSGFALSQPVQTDSFQLSVPKENVKKPNLFQRVFTRKDLYNSPGLFRTAIKNNPQIAVICADNQIAPRVEIQNLKDTHLHAHQTEKLAGEIGEKLGLRAYELKTLKLGAKYHDIGKTLIPRQIFAKSAKHTPDEKRIMDLHSDLGVEILKGLGFNHQTLSVVKNHHKNYDPANIADEKLDQICKVADIYCAMRKKRHYKEAIDKDEVLNSMQAMVKRGEIYPEAFEALRQIVA